MQLNVTGLSAVKRHIIQSLAEIHHIDVVCLQETHVRLAEIHHIDVVCLQETDVSDDKSDRDVSDAARVSSSPCCDVIRVGGYHIANFHKPLTEHWNNTNLPPVLLILQPGWRV